MASLLVSKIISLFLMLILTLIAGLVPAKLIDVIKHKLGNVDFKSGSASMADTAICLLNCIGAGVLIATAFVHMLPETRLLLTNLTVAGDIPHSVFPTGEFMVTLGFFFVYFIEEVAHIFICRHKNKKEQKKLSRDCINSDGQSSGGFDPTTDGKDGKYCYTNQLNALQDENGLPEKNGAPATGQFTKKPTEVALPVGHEHAEDHSHFIDMDDSETVASFLHTIMIIMALAFHSVCEGLAIGVQPSVVDVWYLFIAISFHKYVIAFCVGVEMASTGLKFKHMFIQMMIFAVSSPFGTALGIVIIELTETNRVAEELSIALLNAMSAGTLIYVSLLEVLERERKKPGIHGMIKLAFILIGFALMNLLNVCASEDFGYHVAALTKSHVNVTASSIEEVLGSP